MEKIQWEYPSNKNKNLRLTSIVAWLVLSACWTTGDNSRNEQKVQYKEVYIPVPVRMEPEKKLISKIHTHKWPLGDKICTYTYDNREKILKLCDSKPAKIEKNYTKTIPGRTETIPGKTTYIPGKMEPWYGPKYGVNPINGKMEYHYGPTMVLTPGKTEHTQPKNKYIPEKRVYCTKYIPYNQTTWAAMPVQENCN
jgi:hypothetical protein